MGRNDTSIDEKGQDAGRDETRLKRRERERRYRVRTQPGQDGTRRDGTERDRGGWDETRRKSGLEHRFFDWCPGRGEFAADA